MVTANVELGTQSRVDEIPKLVHKETDPTEDTPSENEVSDPDLDDSPSLVQEAPKMGALSDEELIEQAEEHFSEERIRQACRCLRQVQDKSLLTDAHKEMFKLEVYCLEAIEELTSNPQESWSKQGESHGDRDTLIYYKVDKKSNQLTCRIETPIESSLLVPLLAVCNESDLYHTWMPYYKRPFKMGVRHSEQLVQKGRCRQVIKVSADAPWPFGNREALQDAVAFDDIDEYGFIVVKVISLNTGDVDSDLGEIGPPPKGHKRMDFNGNMLFQACPPDHPAFHNSRAKYPQDQQLLLCGLTMCVDAHVAGVPVKMINFITRTLIGRMWGSMLEFAQDVRSGSRPEYAQAIEDKKELYDWVEKRVNVMFERLENQSS